MTRPGVCAETPQVGVCPRGHGQRENRPGNQGRRRPSRSQVRLTRKRSLQKKMVSCLLWNQLITFEIQIFFDNRFVVVK